MAKQRPRDEEEYEDEDEDRPRKRGGAMSHVVPYKNPMALSGYYCGFGALIPGLGCLLGPVAVLLGILGLVKVKKEPEVHGTAHAITGILLGLAGAFLCGPLGLFLGWAAFIAK